VIATQRPDVLVFQGGVVRLPHNPELFIPGIPLPAGHIFACMAETTLLGLSPNDTQPSIGTITPQQVDHMLAVAKHHGYALGELKTMRSF
jgi:predicted amino acid dehydrogenase